MNKKKNPPIIKHSLSFWKIDLKNLIFHNDHSIWKNFYQKMLAEITKKIELLTFKLRFSLVLELNQCYQSFGQNHSRFIQHFLRRPTFSRSLLSDEEYGSFCRFFFHLKELILNLIRLSEFTLNYFHLSKIKNEKRLNCCFTKMSSTLLIFLTEQLS